MTSDDSIPTAEQRAAAKAKLLEHGTSVAQVARQHGLQAYSLYRVLNGHNKCLRGEAHKAAVALGLKKAPDSEIPTATPHESSAA